MHNAKDCILNFAQQNSRYNHVGLSRLCGFKLPYQYLWGL